MSDATNDLDLLQARQRASEAQAAQAQDDAVQEAAASEPAPASDFDLRVQALDFALKKYGTNATDENVIKAAAVFEEYLRDGVSDSQS